MSLCVIELNDSEIRVARRGTTILRSPGAVLVRNGAIHVGEEAKRLARLHPLHAYDRLWADLDQEPLPRPTGRFRHHADLAHAQLLAIHERSGKPAEVVFAVPGSFSEEQLSLLLGIAQACPFEAVGLVDAAVAGAATVAGPGRYLHVELELHRTVLTWIEVVDGEVVRESTETLRNGGLGAIHDASAEWIGDAFVEQCRFDPHQHASTEQALYDELPRCLRALSERSEVSLGIRCGNTRHQARITRERLLEKLERHYASVIRRLEGNRAVLLGDRAASLPGFAERVSADALDADAVFRGCEEHLTRIRSTGPQLTFVTRLPAPPRPSIQPRCAVAAPAGTERQPPVTHLLHGHRAVSLREAPLFLSAGGSISRGREEASSCSIALRGGRAIVTPLSDISTYVNGERLRGSRDLNPGDKVGFAGSDTVYSLISVVESDDP